MGSIRGDALVIHLEHIELEKIDKNYSFFRLRETKNSWKQRVRKMRQRRAVALLVMTSECVAKVIFLREKIRSRKAETVAANPSRATKEAPFMACR